MKENRRLRMHDPIDRSPFFDKGLVEGNGGEAHLRYNNGQRRRRRRGAEEEEERGGGRNGTARHGGMAPK